MQDKAIYDVIVGNIGSVCQGTSKREALLTFKTYVDRSQSGHGRCAGEDVTMFRNAEIIKEYIGTCNRCGQESKEIKCDEWTDHLCPYRD